MVFELKNIYKDYLQGKEAVPVLKDISLEVSEGEYVAIMGPSGSGKSTLMNIIGCLDKQTKGSFVFDGCDIMQAKDRKLSEIRNKKIGFVFQNFNLLPRQSALENVELPLLYAGVGKRERRQRAKAALEKVGLAQRMMFKPTQLSGGQKQRSSIARALLKNAPVLIMDDSLSAVDTDTEEQILENLIRLRKGKTTIIIAHRVSTLQKADHIAVLTEGELTEYGTHDELIREGGFYAKIYEKQQLEQELNEM